MKKTISIVSLVLAACVLNACKEKTYTCTCEGGLTGGTTFSIESRTKKGAENKCASNNGDPAVDGYFNCHIE